MNFYWNAYSLYNLSIDIFILVGSSVSFYYFFTKKNLSVFQENLISKDYFFTFLKSFFFVFFFGSAIGILLGKSSFLRVHILWTLITIFFPLYLLIHLIKNKKYFLVPLILFIISFKYYAEKIEPNRLDVERITIRTNKIKNPIRITHISDLQTDDIRELHFEVRKISNSFNPDLIFFTGDVLNHISIKDDVEQFLSGLQKKQSSYFVSGNIDGILNIEDFTEKSNFLYFDNRTEILQIGKDKLGIIGISLSNFTNEKLIESLQEEIKTTDFKILLSHYPDSVLNLKDSNIDLILAGHTHGGQVCLPFIGPIITLSNVPREIAAGGLHIYNGINIIVSRGLGMEGHTAPRIRILNRPHLILLELLPN